MSTASVAGAQSLGVDVDAGMSAGAGNSGTGVDTGINTGTSMNADDDMMDIEVSESGSAGTTIDLKTGDEVDGTSGGATATLLAEADATLAVNGVKSEDQVKLIMWTDVDHEGSYSGRLFTQAAARGDSYRDVVQTQVDANATLVAALESHGFGTENVVTLRSTTDGRIVLFVDDRA
jgi:hypothetical protein